MEHFAVPQGRMPCATLPPQPSALQMQPKPWAGLQRKATIKAQVRTYSTPALFQGNAHAADAVNLDIFIYPLTAKIRL